MLVIRSTQQRRPRSGIMAILVAVGLFALLAIVALVLDGGVLLAERRHARAVADAAAFAAACDLYAHYSTNNGLDPSGTAAKSATDTAAANGYSNDGTTSTVTVNIPPASGDYKGKAGYAEVLVQYNQSRYFSQIFASSTIPVTARAVARGSQVPLTNLGVVVLDGSAQKALNVTGPGNVDVKSGGVYVDSSSSQAAVITGSGSVIATEAQVVGTGPGYQTTGSGTFSTTPSGNIQTGQPVISDPLASIAAPDPTSLTTQSSSQLNISSSQTLQPGRYIGGIQISNGTITMEPGTYYMDHGGFSVSNGNVSGSGVMIYNDPNPGSGQKVSVTGGTFNLSAPTSGPYQGIVVFQARDAGSTEVDVTGGGTSQMLGAIYAAGSPVNITGSGGVIVGSLVVSDTLNVTGSGPFNVDWNGSPEPATSDIRIVE